MKHRSLKITAFFLSLVFVLSLFQNVFSFAANASSADVSTLSADVSTPIVDKKIISTATIEDDFAENAILIVLNKEETQKFKSYTKDDFAGLKIANVANLTASTAEVVKAKMDSISVTKQSAGITKTNNSLSIDSLDISKDTSKEETVFEKLTEDDVDSFRSILYIELEEPGKANVLAAIKQLETNEDFLYVGPNHYVYMCATPNDANYSEQWGLPKISAPTAWDTRTNAKSTVHVGVVDTGIQANHPDLVNQIYSSKHRDFTTGVTEGTVIAVEDLVDPNGHGTHVAGIIGAQGDNSIGGTGVCWDINLISLRVLGSNGSGSVAHIVNAINYAQTANIDILNMSFSTTAYNGALQTAISNYTGLIVAAAGNDNANTDNTRYYPSSFTDTYDNVISVGASDSNDERSNWNGFSNLWGLFGSSKSNYGKTTVDIFAPGTDIYSTLRNGNYGKMSGTSMAAPYVTGVAALMMSIRTNLKPADVKHMINYTSDAKSALTDLCVSGGRINAAEAIKAAANTLKISVSSRTVYTERTMTISPDVGYKDFIVTFKNTGNRVVQTFGANTLYHDGYLELFDMEGNLLDYSDDDGYERNALISYNFQADVSYRIRVRFCITSTQSGDIRLGIVPTYSYDNYDNIYSLTDYTRRLTWSFAQNNVKMLTYNYTTTRELTMTVTSDADTYLFIIDPSSTEEYYEVWADDETITSNYSSLANDDYYNEGGEYVYNSKLKKTFNAGIPYLVLVSAYDPSSAESTGSFYIDFE